MNLDDIKDQLQEFFSVIKDRAHESQTYNNALEYYETLPPQGQRGVKVGAFVLSTMLLLSFPMSFYSSSSESIEIFESDRSQIRRLLRAGRPLPKSFLSNSQLRNAAGLISAINTKIGNERLLDEQKSLPKEIDPFKDAGFTGTKKIQGVEIFGAQVELKKLNITQIKRIGNDLQKIVGAKLAGINISASADNDHYFNVAFQLVGFALPDIEDDDNGKNNKRNGRPKSGRAKNKTNG